ncbi:hypothetical protein [Halogranum rubrum]|uniref:DUF8215 domain-containing protein n=1 Tax=Halogranum salarium B-1 TaxID=1210908 RepID=J2ZKR2_9EURY|nr:hypothetical protein [Halogranum salarium]EJN61305.1 hypothetical protein HSB1_03460 [Halogranum salarium B-1]
MPPNRGTDFSTDQRQIRPREEESELSKWLQDAFDATAEVLVFSIPVLAVVFLTSDVELTFVTLAVIGAFSLGVTVQRHRPLGPAWPPMSPRLVLGRLLFYNIVLVAGLGLGGLAFTDPVVGFSWVEQPILGPSLLASLVALVAVAGFPSLVAAVGRRRRR